MRDPLFKLPNKPDPKFSHLDPFIGNTPNSSFDILTWIAENPMAEPITITEFSGDITAIGQVPIPPCLENAIRHENPRHHVRVALAQHLAEELRWFASPSAITPQQRKEIVDKIVAFMASLGWRDYNEGVTRFHVESLMNYESSPSASWYRNNGLCDGVNCWAHGGN